MATPYVCSESSRVGEMIITPVPEREGGRRKRGGRGKVENEKAEDGREEGRGKNE